VKQFNWGGFNNTDSYFDETNTRMVMNFRNNYARLAESLLIKGENEKAIQTLDKCMSEFPREVIKFSYFAIPIIDLYLKLDEKEKGKEMLSLMIDDHLKEFKYLKEFKRGSGTAQNLNICGQVLGSLARVVQIHKLENNAFDYFEKEGSYFRLDEKDNEEEVDYSTFRINTFMQEYLALQ